MVFLALAVLISSFSMTGFFRNYAFKRSLIDIPNARSSHSRPTPRGGGVAIVVSLSFGLAIFCWLGEVSFRFALAVGLGGLLVAAVSYLDDRYDLPARWRFLVHVIAAGWALWWLGGIPPLLIFDQELRLDWLGILIGGLFIVWLLNLYNFMDGIDGIAGVEAVTVACSAAVLLGLGGDSAAALQLLLLAAAALGFLLWNWPPAKIFMGDVGSAYLGFVFAVIALETSREGPLNLWVWLILLAVFITDASVTLLRRLWRGERWYQAHRSHAYQQAARRFGSHLKVTLTVGALNVLWLLPLAGLASMYSDSGWWLAGLAYTPLVVIALALNAGVCDSKNSTY
ncbi:MAG TPA: glycosyltransferase family 4 protein [Gammaproteobacteria bacterium]|nr:glycosyltransferase family 4 protein [Gammaproteobacteria bacterium]